MDEKKLLYYKVIRDEYVFYYDRYILFKNSKTNPFMFVIMEKEGAKKQLPLYYCDIQKYGTNGFKIKFYNNSCTVNVTVNYMGNRIFFNFDKMGLSGEKLYINMYKRQAKITGLGLNHKKDLNKTVANIYGKSGRKIGAYDTKLAFSVKGSYFLKNNGIDDWDVNFCGTCRIGTRQKTGGFTMEFNKQFDLNDKVNYHLRMVNPEEMLKYAQKGTYSGFITLEEEKNIMRRRISEMRKYGYKYYIDFSPVIRYKSKEFNNYDPNGLIYIGNECFLIDVTHESNKRVFTNKVRDLLDLNIDGFYIDEINIKIMKSIIIQNALIYKNLTDLINRISEEYPSKIHIYNKFNSSQKRAGIYSCNYSAIKRKEAKYKRSLLYSDIGSVFYECTDYEANKLIKQGKTQIIVKNKKWFIFNDFIKKKPKIKHFKNL